jgi:hypothetical protein
MTGTQVSAYVNAADFRPIGGTYHDTGMIWGTRLLSPPACLPPTPRLGPARPPNRVIVFLTDGLMAPSTYIYGMYGNEYYDKRVSGEISAIWPAITTCAFWPNAARPRRATSTSGPFRSPRWRPPR